MHQATSDRTTTTTTTLNELRHRRPRPRPRPQHQLQLQQDIRNGKVANKLTVIKSDNTTIYMVAIAIAIAVTILVTLVMLLTWEPEFVFGPSYKDYVRVTGFFPSTISPRKDLPLIFNSYAVATTENSQTRQALRHVQDQSQIMTNYKGRQRVIWLPWEDEDVERILTFLKHSFPMDLAVYTAAPRHAQRDLALYFWMSLGGTKGYVDFGMEVITPVPPQQRIAVQEWKQERIFSGFLFVPLKSAVPGLLYKWIIEQGWKMSNEQDYTHAKEAKLYQYIHSDEEEWHFFDRICDSLLLEDYKRTNPQRRRFGRYCLSNQTCCGIFMSGEQ